MSETSSAPTIATKTDNRPVTLAAAAVVLVLAAVLTFASPWLPRGRGFGFGTQGPRNGQAGTGTGGTGGAGGGGGAGGAGGGFGAGGGGAFTAGGGAAGAGAANRANFAMIARALPIVRTAEAILGGLFTLIAAIGIWQRQKWGMALALIGSVISLLVAAVTLLTPIVGRAVRAFTIYLTFVTLPSWQALVFLVLAVIVAVLVLLPPSMKGYIVMPKERRVM